MSKKTRLLSALLCLLVLLGSMTLTASAISFTVGNNIGTGKVQTTENVGLTTDGKVTYAKATYTDSGSRTQAVYALEFNPKTSDYLPYVYSKYTGTGSSTYNTAIQAEDKYGAEVIGGVNATFYATATGSTYAGYWVHDGRLAQATAGMQNDIITFSSGGEVRIVNSKLDFKLYLNGREISSKGGSGIIHVNKKSVVDNVDDRFYYWDAECGTKTDSLIAGTEILCKKLDFGELSIGNTLKGEVLEVRADSYYSAVGKDEFVLYVKNGSPLQASVTNAKVGDIVEIAVNEMIEASKPYTETANTSLAAQYPIVKNGVADLTESLSQLGAEFLNARAQRTSIGLKEDGTVLFICTAGRNITDGATGLTVYELADLMVQLGCKTAYNLDGGGSTTMVTKSTSENRFDVRVKSNEGTYGRGVANNIYIVKRQSVDTDVANALNALIDENESNTSAAVVTAITDAETIIANTKSLTSDYVKAYMSLKAALSGKSELDKLLADVSAISYKDYSETILTQLWDVYDRAIDIRADNEATSEEIEEIIAELRSLINLTGTAYFNISKGVSYTKNGGTNDTPNYQDTDDKELTDGVIASSKISAYGPDWVGFHQQYRGGTESGAPYYDVTINFDSVQSGLSKFCVYSEVEWGAGISAPTKVLVSVSENGTDFTEVGTAIPDVSNYKKSLEDNDDTSKVNTTDILYTLMLDEGVSGKHVKFHIVGNKDKPFVFVSEIQVFKKDAPVDEAIFVNGFNQMITTGKSVIFTPDYADTLTTQNANLNWARAIAAQWDAELGAYKVTRVANGNGSNVINTVPENGFVLGVHGEIAGSIENRIYANTVKVMIMHGIDVSGKAMRPGSYITVTQGNPLKESSTIRINGAYIEGATDEMTVTEIAAMFYGTITIKDRNNKAITGSALVGTGSVITAGSKSFIVIVKGDISGDGKIDGKDYMFAKRAFLKTYTLDEVQLKAGCLSGQPLPTAIDYLKIKRHFLGTYNIFAK